METFKNFALIVDLYHSLCKTTTTSKQTLLSHADGKKHRAKAKAYHASQKQANGVEQTPKETVGAPVTESAQVNNERSTENERGVDNDAAKRKRANDTTSEEPDNTKRPNNLSVNSGEVVQSSNEEAETKAKSKGTKDELVSSANLKGSKKQKIKWKKIITKVLQTVGLLYNKHCSTFVLCLCLNYPAVDSSPFTLSESRWSSEVKEATKASN